MIDNVADSVRLAIELQLGHEEVSQGQRLAEDLDATSFDLLNLVITLEENHGIHITEQAAAQVRTVGDLVALVESLVEA